MTDEAQGGSPLDLARALREFGLGLPDTEEGVACVGTPLEKRTLTTRRKAFLFLGAGDAMFKLRASLPQAIASAAGDPSSCKVGAHGWVTVRFGQGGPSLEVLQGWVRESYSLFGKA